MHRSLGAAALVGAALLLSPPSAPAQSSAGSGASTALPELPVVEVKPRRVYTFNEDALPPPRRPGASSVATPPPASPSPGAGGATVAAAAPRVAAPRRSGPLAGPAQPDGPVALTVAGAPIRLFGIRPPDARDRCGLREAATACGEAARLFLARRLGSGGTVACEVPARPGAAICRDRQGVDLASLLVNEGLALADPTESYDYVHAETSARTQRRGLWLYR
jgi:endonuclease YncB( thermonuclease family)